MYCNRKHLVRFLDNNKGTKRPYRGQILLTQLCVVFYDTRMFMILLRLNALETLQGVFSDYRSSMLNPHVMNSEIRSQSISPFVSTLFLWKLSKMPEMPENLQTTGICFVQKVLYQTEGLKTFHWQLLLWSMIKVTKAIAECKNQ